MGIRFPPKCKKTGETMALKQIKLRQTQSGFPITSLRELALLLELKHENVVQAHEIVVRDGNIQEVYMVMEYCEHDFSAILKIKRQLNKPFIASEVKCLMKQLLSGFEYMHSNWILHRDLKPSNILLNKNGILK